MVVWWWWLSLLLTTLSFDLILAWTCWTCFAGQVVNLLEDMKKKLEEEAEKDEDVDEKMKCWCKVRRGKLCVTVAVVAFESCQQKCPSQPTAF